MQEEIFVGLTKTDIDIILNAFANVLCLDEEDLPESSKIRYREVRDKIVAVKKSVL